MCVAILQPAGVKTIEDDRLFHGWASNPDGGGFAFINPETNKIETFKSMSYTNFAKEYKEAHAKYGADSPFIVHMRIATSGNVDINTAHPFEVKYDGEGELVFAHNGIIHDCNPLKSDKSGRSDTMIFRDEVLNKMSPAWLDNDDTAFLMMNYIGWSKLVFISTVPTLESSWYILNEGSGDWVDGSWYSNDSCEAKQWTYKGKAVNLDSWDKYEQWEKEYKDGYGKATYDPKSTRETFVWDEVYGSVGEVRRLVSPKEMRETIHDKDKLTAYIKKAHAYPEWVCDWCFSIGVCQCEDICVECFEEWQMCECDDDYVGFVSIMNYVDNLLENEKETNLDSVLITGPWDKVTNP